MRLPVIHRTQKATGLFDVPSSTIVLLKGSVLGIDLVIKPPANIAANYREVQRHVDAGAIRPLPRKGYEVVRDIPGLSPSAAHVFATGKPGSGWQAWRIEDGRTLDALRQSGTSGVAPRTKNASPSARPPMPPITPPQSAIASIPAPEGFNPDHWHEFVKRSRVGQGAVGSPPALWAKTHGITLSGVALPTDKCTRQQVAERCRDPEEPVLLGYICAMAWGDQGKNPITRSHPARAWTQRATIGRHIQALRSGKLTRAKAYDLFCAAGAIKYLGPAFFTKLIYFFDRSQLTKSTGGCYIMDQWTARSINLLTGRKVVHLVPQTVKGKRSISVATTNTGASNYAPFCAAVDTIAQGLGCSGAEAEERLFCSAKPDGPWRRYVKRHG